MILSQDFRELFECLNARRVRYLVVGGYAVAHHGHPRATKDIDIWVHAGKDNARLIIRALAEFGAPLTHLGIVVADFESVGQTIQLGVAPLRIDLLTQIDGMEFDTAWQARSHFDLGEHRVPVIGREQLIVNKRASGRPQDLADVIALEVAADDLDT